MPSILPFSTSILPAHLSYIEYWAVRFFLLMAFLTIGPWIFLILYDFLLYLFRVAVFEVPYVGGRARGKTRPRAPSVNVHGDGSKRRRFSFVGGGSVNQDGSGMGTGVDGAVEVNDDGLEVRSRGVRRAVLEEERDMRSWEVVEDSEREDRNGGAGRRRK